MFDCMQGGTALHQERSTGSSLRQARPLHVPGTLPKSFSDALTSQISLRLRITVYRAVQKRLTSQVYDFIQTIQQPGQADSQPTQTHATIAKEEQIIPDIIYQIEEFEKQLIQLSSKGAFLFLRAGSNNLSAAAYD